MSIDHQTHQLDAFLERMNHAVAWDELGGGMEAASLGAGTAKNALHPSVAARIYFMQRCFGLSDAAMAQALNEVPSMRQFAGRDALRSLVLDEAAIQGFREIFEAPHV